MGQDHVDLVVRAQVKLALDPCNVAVDPVAPVIGPPIDFDIRQPVGCHPILEIREIPNVDRRYSDRVVCFGYQLHQRGSSVEHSLSGVADEIGRFLLGPDDKDIFLARILFSC